MKSTNLFVYGLMIIVIIMLLFKPFKPISEDYREQYYKLKFEHEELLKHTKEHYLKVDSLTKLYNEKDLLFQYTLKNIIKHYENKIKDFSNVDITNNDEVSKFISSYLQNRQ
jgi:hypothetical protein